MMHIQRRSVAGRKAATQALAVIAESIRASRGRKTRPLVVQENSERKGLMDDIEEIQDTFQIMGEANKENVIPQSKETQKEDSNMLKSIHNIDNMTEIARKSGEQKKRGRKKMILGPKKVDRENENNTHETRLNKFIEAEKTDGQGTIIERDMNQQEKIDKNIGLQKSKSLLNKEEENEGQIQMKKYHSDNFKLNNTFFYPDVKEEFKDITQTQNVKDENIIIKNEGKLIMNKSDSLQDQLNDIMSADRKQEESILLDTLDHQDNLTSQAGGIGSQYQGRWTDEEHEKFIEGLKLFGKDWRRIEEFIGSRNCAQIRSHAQKYFNRLHRDIARGIKRSDEAQVASFLFKKKRKHPEESDQKQQKTTEFNLLTPKPKRELMSVVHTTTHSQKDRPLILSQANDLKNLQPTISNASTDQITFQLRQLIAQREALSLEVMIQKVSRESACEALVQITNQFHLLAMQALQICDFELCNRMIDERNLTQFVCILLSREVSIGPNNQEQLAQWKANDLNQEIIQKVEIKTLVKEPLKIQESLPKQSTQISKNI